MKSASRKQGNMKAILDRSVGKALGCISKYNEHCNMKPLQFTASPENVAGRAMGLAEADVAAVVSGASAALMT